MNASALRTSRGPVVARRWLGCALVVALAACGTGDVTGAATALTRSAALGSSTTDTTSTTALSTTAATTTATSMATAAQSDAASTSVPEATPNSVSSAERSSFPLCPTGAQVETLVGEPVSLVTSSQTVATTAGDRFSMMECSYKPLDHPGYGHSRFDLTYTSLSGEYESAVPTMIPEADATTVATRDASYLTDGATSRWVATADTSQCITSVTQPELPGVTLDAVFTATPAGTPEGDCEVSEGFFTLPWR